MNFSSLTFFSNLIFISFVFFCSIVFFFRLVSALLIDRIVCWSIGFWCTAASSVDGSLLVYIVVGGSRCQWRATGDRESWKHKCRWRSGDCGQGKWKPRQHGRSRWTEKWENGCTWTTLRNARRESGDDREKCARSYSNNETCALSCRKIGKTTWVRSIRGNGIQFVRLFVQIPVPVKVGVIQPYPVVKNVPYPGR